MIEPRSSDRTMKKMRPMHIQNSESEMDLSEIPNTSGTYALILHLRRLAEIRIGKLGIHEFNAGYYVYVGSAFGPGGLRGRLTHHLRPINSPKAHWHIDYLRDKPHGATMFEIWWTADRQEREHQWADTLASDRRFCIPIEKFGSSDCGCVSHLFQSQKLPNFQSFVQHIHRITLGHDTVHHTNTKELKLRSITPKAIESCFEISLTIMPSENMK